MLGVFSQPVPKRHVYITNSYNTHLPPLQNLSVDHHIIAYQISTPPQPPAEPILRLSL